ncbi:hypothetical protein HNE05_08055 [Aquipseudomonas campi]|uniref:Uncharacterized protein n=1 Tax=Aquipseudomonas campi TaxID=2731681 RepID=A0A6M8FEP6_9GAMM|nr:hypothetical protein [Pseudomonas campi]QKE63317.1 hypothetical protein HNE05_08055 [Pseudomonas campi]
MKPLIRLMEVLPKNGDTELTLLKCHLLSEEVLTKIISNAFKNPKYLNDARLTFSQKIKLARATGEANHAVWVWKALDLLNQARNELSHTLAHEEVQIKIKKFTHHVCAHSETFPRNIIDSNFTEFHWAMLNTYLVIVSIANYDPAAIKQTTLHAGVGNA